MFLKIFDKTVTKFYPRVNRLFLPCIYVFVRSIHNRIPEENTLGYLKNSGVILKVLYKEIAKNLSSYMRGSLMVQILFKSHHQSDIQKNSFHYEIYLME